MNNYEQMNDIDPKDILAYVPQHGWKYVDELPLKYRAV